MQRFAALAVILFAGTPAISEYSPRGIMNQTLAEVEAMDQELDWVRHPDIRRSLEGRLDRIEGLLARLEATGALDPVVYGPPARPGRPPQQGQVHAGLSFHDAVSMVRAESFDTGKLQAIQLAARNGRFTSAEARLLAAELTFDGGKADALIALYPAVLDKGRFATTLDILTFASTRQRVVQTLGL